jgi:hypothetical protein
LRLGRAISTKINSRGVRDRKLDGSLRVAVSFRAVVVAMAILPCLLALQVVGGQGARAATVPVVTQVTPATGNAEVENGVVISGSGFTGATAVDFGSVPADRFTVDSDTLIEAYVMGTPGDSTVDVTVTTPEGTSATSATDQYTFILSPQLSSISPDRGPATGGNTVTITGADFTGATGVLFDSYYVNASGTNTETSVEAPSFTVDSDTQITAVVPAAPGGPGTWAEVTVVTPNGDTHPSNYSSYRWNPLPVLKGTTPTTGVALGGEPVTLTGTGFTNASAVTFGSTPATSFTVVSDTKITAIAPAVALTSTYPTGLPYNQLDITVTTPNGTSLVTVSSQFTYIPPPVITAVSPAAGPTAGGNTVTITGTGFRFSLAREVTGLAFGSTPVTSYTVNSATQITATVPPGAAGTVDITMTAPGNVAVPTSAADQYTYLPVPAVTGVSPGSGQSVGGNTVTVTGTGFTDASAVSFGTVPATSFTVNSDSSITATVPTGAVGIDDVTVTTPGGTSATSAADHYVYHPTCTTTITGTNSSKITVSSGLTCLVNATQTGQVTVEAGAALSVTGSTVNGPVTATDPAGITYCGSSETGNLTVTGATGPVVLSGALPDGTACGADTISGAVTVTGASAPVTVTGLNEHGTLTLENDTAGVDLDGGQLNGPVYVSNNTAAAPAAITVSGAAITGSLYCTGNTPAPTDAGTLNTVSAAAAPDQCTALEAQ